MKISACIFFVLCTVFLALPAHAQATEVDVGIYILNVGKFDVSTGSYTVDFYLNFKCDKPCSPEKFEFMNGRATSIDKLTDDPSEKFYRIQASLAENIDLRQYPFDSHALTISLEDKEETKGSLVYKVDESNSGIDESVVIIGWKLDGWDAEVKDHYYPAYDETFSRFMFKININRVGLASVLKSFLPVFFMAFVALLSLLLRADKVTTRLTLNISTLLAAVMFHVNLTASIPPVGYLTFADKFMILTYMILIAVLLSGIILMRHTEQKEEALAEKIYKYSLFSIPVAAVAAYAALFVFV